MISRKYALHGLMFVLFLCFSSSLMLGLDEWSPFPEQRALLMQKRWRQAASYVWNYGFFVAGGGAIGWILGSKAAPQIVPPERTVLFGAVSACGGAALTAYRVHCLRSKIRVFYKDRVTVDASDQRVKRALDQCRNCPARKEEGREQGIKDMAGALFELQRDESDADPNNEHYALRILTDEQNNLIGKGVFESDEVSFNRLKDFVKQGLEERESRGRELREARSLATPKPIKLIRKNTRAK